MLIKPDRLAGITNRRTKMSINKNAKYFQTRDGLTKKEAYRKAKEAKKMTFGRDITRMMKSW